MTVPAFTAAISQPYTEQLTRALGRPPTADEVRHLGAELEVHASDRLIAPSLEASIPAKP